MECRYCQTSNSEDDHRCRRCGRRLKTGPVYVGSSAAAPALKYDAADRLQVAPTVARPSVVPGAPQQPRKPITYQPSLFTSRELPRVVPFETISPATRRASEQRVSEQIEKRQRKSGSSSDRPRPRKIIAGQQDLQFASSAVRPSRMPEGAIYCDAPVAIPAHRATAAAIDGSIIVIALALFGLVFHLAGGEIVVNAKTVPLLACVVAVLTAFYRLLWCLADGDTPGMRWTHLILINFDGHPPNRRQRLARTASGLLSLMAGGLGLIWALVDEETLTWHDHISRTFPTPY
jgi:uncharacterized RDD family membrane protein YckC